MLLFVVVPIGGSTQATTLDARHRPGRGVVPPTPRAALQTVSGSLTAMTDSALTVTASGVSYTVNISPTTKIVRRYGAPSDLDEMAPGDLLVVRGSQPVSNTINATLIQDQSIQRAWTHMSGTLQSISGTTAPATATVTVVNDRLNAPFSVGQSIALSVGASTAVISPSLGAWTAMSGTASLPALSAAVGYTVTVMGVYNRQQSAFTTVFRVRTHHTGAARAARGGGSTGTVPVGHPVVVSGTFVSESGITAPVTLSVQTTKYGLITVNVGTSPAVTILRRYRGQSSLDELALGDQLAVQGTFADSTNTSLNATLVRDYSIQDAATRAVLQVTQTTATGFVGTVVASNPDVPHPFTTGQALTVTVDSGTKVLVPATAPATGEVTGSLSNLAANQTVTIRGTFNRLQGAVISAQLVRVHR